VSGPDFESDWDAAELHHLRSAEGWIDLGLPAEALAEIGQLSSDRQREPITLVVFWRLYSHLGEWEKCVSVAGDLVESAPDNEFGWVHRSYALHELRRTEEAAALLRPALEKFPNEELIPYNLACYACQRGDLDEARRLLQLALQRGKPDEIKARALADPDLVPLRDYISQLPDRR
jgi:tetratricopeptide (TPR) repeat protein